VLYTQLGRKPTGPTISPRLSADKTKATMNIFKAGKQNALRQYDTLFMFLILALASG
jgi:hypothetical protein